MGKKFKPLNVICGCEVTQAVMSAFLAKGHNAYSCDIQKSGGAFPDRHLQMDIFEAIKLKRWDLGIFFPPCDFLTVSGNRWFKDQPKMKSGALVGKARRDAQTKAVQFVKDLWDADIPRIAIENPIGVLSTKWKPPTQIIQPWMFGHGETKATCLWLKGLPRLNGTNVVEGREQRIWKMGPSDDRKAERSATFQGIAEAMSSQWSYFQ